MTSDKCNALTALAELTTRVEMVYHKEGVVDYEAIRQIIAELSHEIQVKRSDDVNSIKKELGIYHNE